MSTLVGQHAASEVHHIGEASRSQNLGCRGTACSAATEDDDSTTLVELANAGRQLAERDVDGAWQGASGNLVGLSDVDKLAIITNSSHVVGYWMIGMGHDHGAF